MFILICGIPNAGKTTYSEKYDNVIHLDDFRDLGSRKAFQEIRRLLSRTKEDAVVEGVYGSAQLRKELLRACHHQDQKICIWLDTDVAECIRRELAYRKRPIGIVYGHHHGFEPPSLEEGWDEIIHIEGV